MKEVSCAVERLDSIALELARNYPGPNGPFVARAVRGLRALQNVLSSALQEAQRVHTTEQPLCTQTSLNNISKDTLEAIEVSALLLVQSMKTIAGNVPTVEITVPTPTKSEAVDGTDEEDPYYWDDDSHYYTR